MTHRCFRKQPEIKPSLLSNHSSSLQMEIDSKQPNKRKHSESSSSEDDDSIKKKTKIDSDAIIKEAIRIRDSTTPNDTRDLENFGDVMGILRSRCCDCMCSTTSGMIRVIRMHDILEINLGFPVLFRKCVCGRSYCPYHTCGTVDIVGGLRTFGCIPKGSVSAVCKYLYQSPMKMTPVWRARVHLFRTVNKDYVYMTIGICYVYHFLAWCIQRWWKRCMPKRRQIVRERMRIAAEATGLADDIVQFGLLPFDTHNKVLIKLY